MTAALLAATTGCGAGLNCTATGVAPLGLTVAVAPALRVRSGSVEVRICDGGTCREASRTFAVRGSSTQQLDLAPNFSWGRIGKRFGPGTVTVRARVRDDAGALRAEREQRVRLVAHHPNGVECDGNSMVAGSVEVRAGDAT